MIAIFYLVLQVLKLYSYVVIANVIISWLVAFNVLNTSNRFVYAILDFTYRLTEPILNKIRRFLPNLGALDISPIILLLLIWFIEMCMKLYIAPIIFNFFNFRYINITALESLLGSCLRVGVNLFEYKGACKT